MPVVHRLTALKVSKLKNPGMYPDGAGLYLQVSGDGAQKVTKSWVYKYTLKGRKREMGLGSYQLYSLKEARDKARQCRRLKHSGIDPIEARRTGRVPIRPHELGNPTFRQCAEQYIGERRRSWSNEKHAAQWETTLVTYVYPIIGELPVQRIDTAHLLKILSPIWPAKTETAMRLRGRIEMILDWSKAKGHRSEGNPARWRGHLDKLLPKSSRVRRAKRHPALPYTEMGTFMSRLRGQNGISARALEFLILTATRTAETIEAAWSEMDMRDNIWIIPGTRMKSGREHRVPLSAPASVVLRQLRLDESDRIGPVFTGRMHSLSSNALRSLLHRMGYGHVTVHGFRSTFRDWAGDCTDHAEKVVEMALAHVNDATEAAYRRGDAFEKRRALMEDWAEFCATVSRSANPLSSG